jgi:hypothetical protein
MRRAACAEISTFAVSPVDRLAERSLKSLARAFVGPRQWPIVVARRLSTKPGW